MTEQQQEKDHHKEDLEDFKTSTFHEVEFPSNETTEYTPVLDVDSPSYKPVGTVFCVPGYKVFTYLCKSYVDLSPKVLVWKFF